LSSDERTPKHYDGSLSTSKRIGPLLAQLLQQLSCQGGAEEGRVLAAWPEVVGERVSPMTRALSYRSGVLRVSVSNSTLYSLLVEHEKPRLLALLKEKLPKINLQNIRFQMG